MANSHVFLLFPQSGLRRWCCFRRGPRQSRVDVSQSVVGFSIMGHWELLFILSFSRYMPTLSPLREQSDLGLDKPQICTHWVSLCFCTENKIMCCVAKKHRHPSILYCSDVVASHWAAWQHSDWKEKHIGIILAYFLNMPEIDYAFGKVRQGEDADRPAYRCLLALSPKLYVFFECFLL
jgi:hypothetical protein